MRPFLRFPLLASDQASVTVSTIQATDVPYAAAPIAGAPYPQSLQLTFSWTGATNPRIIPLFPGTLRFVPDPAAPGFTPQPAAIDAAKYSQWKTRGILIVRLADKDLATEFLTLMLPVGPIPTTLWYGPVVITKDFLFTTIATGLKKQDVVAGRERIKPANALWQKHAIARFLQGLYQPELKLGATAADDDVAKFPMPEIFGSSGAFNLNIHIAQMQRAQDGLDDEFDANSDGQPRREPANQANGAIPARHVYRTLRSDLIDALPGAPMADAVLKDWPHAVRYFPFRVTRTWNRVPNVSIHFPLSTIRVATSPGGTLLAEQRLPAHGWFFLSQQPAAPEPSPPTVAVTLTGDVRWIDGATPNVWRRRGGTAPIVFPLVSALPHIVFRRRMRDEIFADESRPNPGSNRCTYMSLRRTLRALVDNRITGGRLVYELTATEKVTKTLLEATLGAQTAQVLFNGRPLPKAKPTTTSPTLMPIWEALFPDPAPAHSVNGSTARTTNFNMGQVAYFLWQVGKEEAETGTRSNFSNDHVGRGSAGALVATGLAAGYTTDSPRLPLRASTDTDNLYFDRMVEAMITTLQPGSLLQFWVKNSDFEKLKVRNWAIEDIGHSPTYVKPMAIDPATNKPKGIVVIDQFGESNCPISGPPGNRRIKWWDYEIEIWCSAAWDE